MKLVASAIVHNEADRYLETWLRHLLTFCDEVRLLDDRSTDATREIAESFAPFVVIEASTAPPFMEYESEARNALLAHTMRGQPDYVLSIDADEFVGDTVALRASMTVNPSAVYALIMREVWRIDGERLGLRVDGLWGDRKCPVLWRAPAALRGSRWLIPRRKLASGREPQAVRSAPSVKTGIGLYHFGWTRVSDRQARAERYFVHDGGRFHADRHLQSILWPDERVQFNWVPWPPSIPEAVATLSV